nr:hypothetical protein [Tanacetum cinerariifolium]
MLQMIVHKDVVINVKSSSINGYLDKIVALTHAASSKDSLVGELEASLSRDKALVERLNDALTLIANRLIELRRVEPVSPLSRQAHICLYDVMQAFCETSLLPPASEAIASTFARFEPVSPLSRQAHICLFDVMQAFCETSLLPPASEAIASTFARFHILAGGSNINTKKRF